MAELDGTQVFDSSPVTPEKMKEFYPDANDQVIGLLCKMTLSFPPACTFVYADTAREKNETGYYQILEGHIDIGLNDPHTSEFVTVHDVRLPEHQDHDKPVGIYVPREFKVNNISLRSGCNGLTVIRMPYEFIDKIFANNEEVRNQKIAEHRELLLAMIAGLNKMNDPQKTIKVLMVLFQEYIQTLTDLSKKEITFIINQFIHTVGGLYGTRNNVKSSVSTLGVQELIGAFARKKQQSVISRRSDSSI